MLRYGPAGVGAAQPVRAYLLNETTARYDPARSDAVVDAVPGRGFRQPATTTGMRRSLAVPGDPTPPPGAC